MSHAPGFSGMPALGHRSRASTRASWARSSASPTSRTIALGAAHRRDHHDAIDACGVHLGHDAVRVEDTGIDMGMAVDDPGAQR
jgi:hypothetical protein